MQYPDLKQLRTILTEYYSASNLRTMCFDMGIDYEDLEGGNKSNKVVSLIQHMQNHGRLDELVQKIQKTRPFIQLKLSDTPLKQVAETRSESPAVMQEIHNYHAPVYKQGDGGTMTQKIDNSKTTDNSVSVGGNVGAGAAVGKGASVKADTIVGGDYVKGDKIAGDKIMSADKIDVGRVSGESVVAIGRGAQAAGRDIHTGDNITMSGDFRGANVNVKATLTNVNQTIGALPQANETEKAYLQQLVTQLNETLQKAPADKAEEAEAVVKMTEAFVETAKADKPNKMMMEITGEGLKKAAANLAGIVPDVVKIAGALVAGILGLG